VTKAKNKKEDKASLKIQGPLTIYEVIDVRDRFLEHLKKTGELRLELEEVTDCDTAGIQLLYSALKTAKDRGQAFDLKSVSMAVKEAAERAGIAMELFCKGQ
jgi:anti-anti-sigma regulatory factor